MMLEWESYAKSPSTFPTTPSCWSIYMCGLNLEYMLSLGGVNELNARAKARSDLLYKFIDESNGYYTNNVEAQYRSRINIPFRVCENEAIETKFLKEATEEGLLELKGHKLVGGCRASLYNAMSFEGTYALINFMKKFMQKNPKQ